jgi:hypothetical protein
MGSKKRIIQYAYLLTKMGALNKDQKDQLLKELKKQK